MLGLILLFWIYFVDLAKGLAQLDDRSTERLGKLQIAEYSKRQKQFTRSHVTKIALNEPIKFK